MSVKDFAPHLSGRMLPGLFSCDLKIGQRERFPGDPWPHFPPSPTWHWMHTTECGTPNHIGSCTSRPIERVPFPADLDALFVSLPAARPDQTPPKAVVADDRPSVGSMGARQPADAGPLEGQRELFEAIA